MNFSLCLSTALIFCIAPTLSARVVEYDLFIAEQGVSPAGKPVKGLTINGTIPGPTLRFTEGDWARIRVHNRLRHHETSTHWHGLLLPNPQDGVPYINTPPILPGQTHTFEFQLKHSGTYWYHSHTHLQEQSGVYGSIIVTPRGGEPVAADREQVLVLSDWTNLDPAEVLRMLMRGGNYFGLMRGNAQSLLGAVQQGRLRDYLSREWSKMPPMDLSDVGYHAFLMNGRRQEAIAGNPGERVRLRVINAAAASYFYLQSSAGPLQIIAADGPAVQPVEVDRLLMGIAETYDVVITIPRSGRYELRATAQDGSGRVSAFFGQGALHAAADPPRPNTYAMDQMADLAVAEQDADPRAVLRLDRPGSPYRLLRSLRDTTLPARLPRRKIQLHLTGDMIRYVWSFDGKTVGEAPYVHIKKGEVIQLELINDTMMHHPIHLHGHFFRVLMGQGRFSPLKHTIDVPPMTRRLVEFEANEDRDWMFHCHILYHMMSGMARVFRYDDAAASRDPAPMPGAMGGGMHHGSLGEHAHDMSHIWGAASLQSHMSEGLITWMNPRNDVLLGWEAGWRGVDDFEYEADLLYQRYFNADIQAFAGARLTNDPEAENRGVAGLQYRLPMTFWLGAGIDSEGDGRFTLAKELQLTPRLGLFGRAQYDTNTRWEWTAGAGCTLSRAVSLVTQYHSRYGFGAGLRIRF